MPGGHHRFFFRHHVFFRHPHFHNLALVLRSSLRLVGHTSTAGERYGLHTTGKERTFAMFEGGYRWRIRVMKSKLFGCLSAALLGAALALPTPAMAFRGGGGFGGGGMHFGGGGFGGGGMHFGGGGFGGGGMHFGGMPGGGMRFGGMPGRGMVMGRSALVPGAGRFATTPFAGRRFGVNRFNNFAFRRNAFFFRHHHHFRNFAFAGAGLGLGYGYGGCWQQVWTGYGYQWVNVCNDYGDGYGY